MSETEMVAIRSVLVAVAVAVWPLPALPCDESMGEVLSLQIDGDDVLEAPPEHVSIEREGNVVTAVSGEPLCENDRVTTSDSAQAIIRLGKVDEAESTSTLKPGTVTVIRSETALELFLGSLFVELKGRFNVIMSFGELAASGTAYELTIQDSGFDVAQVEGETQFSGMGVASASVPPSTAYRYRPGDLDPSTSVALDPELCAVLVDANSQAVLRARPSVPSENRLLDDAGGSLLNEFVEVRRASLCANDPAASRQLGRALVALGRPQRALERLVAGTLSMSGEALAAHQVAIAQLHLAMGNVDEAIAALRLALSADDASVSALAGLGDAHRDRGLLLADSRESDGTVRAFAEAQRFYQLALGASPLPQPRGVILVSLGNLALLQATLESDNSEAWLRRANTHFDRAVEVGATAHGRLGLALIPLQRAQLVPTQRIVGGDYSFGQLLLVNVAMELLAERLRKPHRKEARDRLQELVAEVPGFSPALEWLGIVEGMLGDRRAARRYLRRAIAVDPGNTSAYSGYASVASKAERKRYRSAYRKVEFERVRTLQAQRREMITETAGVEVSAAPLTASVPVLKFSLGRQGSARDSVSFTNRAELATTVASVEIEDNGHGAFSIVSDTCKGQEIRKDGECAVGVRFSAQQQGTYQATLRLEGENGLWEREVQLHGDYSLPVVQ